MRLCRTWRVAWRPDASWAVPRLPDDWFEVDGMEAGSS